MNDENLDAVAGSTNLFPLQEYDAQTLLYGMARDGKEFTAAELNKVLGRADGDIRSYASLQGLVQAALLSRSCRGHGCARYKFNLMGTVELLETCRLVPLPFKARIS
ncbi:hypothetical protein JF770_05980 [Mycobacterium intracellulare]|uniref:hypothetical protein n=1 Tax=Mycobacterium intracellulare TaxID=1767 RepID=UPI001CDA4C73|nr:hypothetical protein [Mycobacterium intracellulare]MCA2303102.1 hypothetical protein [Mycobacterium intracellulare]MCA2345306.1 hypothetical protein [Mycobacterium intracellulare]